MDMHQEMRHEILRYLEKNSRVNLQELAVLLGVDETLVANEIADMEKEKIICGYHFDRLGQDRRGESDCVDRSTRDAAEKSGI